MNYLKNVATLRYDRALCKGCGRCAEVCPRGVFRMKDKRAEIRDKDLCMECGACRMNCAHGAIEVRSGVGCASAILASGSCSGEAACCS